MHIQLTDAGKKFGKDWIFKNFSFSFNINESYAITGPNGSGKSTLLQVIAGNLMCTKGQVEYVVNNEKFTANHEHISICAPYLELIEEMTATEFLQFHFTFKKSVTGIPNILQAVGLEQAANKQIRNFSSGMKQRLKLAQAFFSNTSILLLDEPCSNLDAQGIQLYHTLIKQYSQNRIVIICSNDEQEFNFCKHHINIAQYK